MHFKAKSKVVLHRHMGKERGTDINLDLSCSKQLDTGMCVASAHSAPKAPLGHGWHCSYFTHEGSVTQRVASTFSEVTQLMRERWDLKSIKSAWFQSPSPFLSFVHLQCK